MVSKSAHIGQDVFVAEVHEVDDATGEANHQVTCPRSEGTGSDSMTEV